MQTKVIKWDNGIKHKETYKFIMEIKNSLEIN